MAFFPISLSSIFLSLSSSTINPCICFIYSGVYRQGLNRLLNCFNAVHKYIKNSHYKKCVAYYFEDEELQSIKIIIKSRKRTEQRLFITSNIGPLFPCTYEQSTVRERYAITFRITSLKSTQFSYGIILLNKLEVRFSKSR